MEGDFLVVDLGTIWKFTPLTERANLEVGLMDLEDWQWMGNSFHVDHRPARQLVEDLEAIGYTFEKVRHVPLPPNQAWA